jgi:hypothetical protein
MKKPKLRLDKATIQEFLLQHVEKIVFGLLALVFLYFVWSATRVSFYPRTPTQLTSAVAAGQRTLDLPPEGKSERVVQNYDVQVKQNSTPVDEKPYRGLANWSPPVFPTRGLRGVPTLYGVEGLRGTDGFGAMSLLTEPAAGGAAGAAAQAAVEIQGQRWVVLTGLVPYDREVAAFDDVLKNAGPTGSYQSQRDTPFYIGYDVQRVEIVSPTEAAKPNWEKAVTILSSQATLKALSRWAQRATQDVVSGEHFFPPKPENLAFPLGPLAGSAWGESAAHAPEIPLADSERLGTGRGGVLPGPVTPLPGAGPQPPVAAGGGDATDPYGDDPTGPAAPGAPLTPPGPGAGPTAPANPAANSSSYLLFRFFDFDVQPGKQYAYRVRLVLRNPNYKKYNVKPTSLKDPAEADKPRLTTKWSDEGDPPVLVTVQDDTRILAVSVTAKSTRDPVAKILVNKWSKKQGRQTHNEFDVVRGQVADFPDVVVQPSDVNRDMRTPPGGGMMPMPGGRGMMPVPGGFGGGMMPVPGGAGGRGMMPMPGGAGGRGMMPMPGPGGRGMMPMPGGPGGQMIPPGGGMAMPGVTGAFKVNYFTHAIIVDLRGGETLRGRKSNSLHLSAPGAILLQDRDGNLVVRDELDDLPAYREIVPAEAAAPPAPNPAHERTPAKAGGHREKTPQNQRNPAGGHQKAGGRGKTPAKNP